MRFLIGIAYLLFAVETLSARALPALGKRKYLLDAKHPERPATIDSIESPASALDGTVMKDPIPLGKLPLGGTGRPLAEPKPVVAKTSRLKFEKVAVGGRYLVPRVSLEKEYKEIKPAEESIKQDYKKKIQESEQILQDLNW